MLNLPDVPLRQIIVLTLAAALIIVLGLVIAAMILYPDRDTSALESQPVQRSSGLEEIIGPLGRHHFYFPNPEDDVLKLQMEPFREPGTPWSEDEIQPFMLDPVEIGLEEVVEQNRELIQDLYDTIP